MVETGGHGGLFLRKRVKINARRLSLSERMTHPQAVALRPVRMDERNNRFVNYEATTFPKNPRAGCEMYIRRLKALGFIEKDSPLAVDVLDLDGDILDTIMISRRGFEYLRRQLKFRREPTDDVTCEVLPEAGGAERGTE